MSEQNILKYMEQLRELLPKLRAGEIDAIEFGEAGRPLGFMSHHRIQFLSTAGGFQPCIKEIHRGMLGSGDYLGGDADDRIIEIKAQTKLVHYMRPTPLREELKRLRAERPGHTPPELCYFAVE